MKTSMLFARLNTKAFVTAAYVACLCLTIAINSGCRTTSPATASAPSLPPGFASETGAESDFKRSPTITIEGTRDQNIAFGVPMVREPLQQLVNVGYTVGYSQRTRTPLWVSYRLFAVGNVAAPPRDDLFDKDDRVPNPVGKDDYAGSGYDRGHLAPSSPIGKRYGKTAQDATFKMTNMCPQLPGLNQRGWEALERVISTDWAERFKELWVFTGPIFQGSCQELLSGVRVPSDCYMVIVYRTPQNEVRALGVIMPQRRINQEPLSLFVRSIDEIERLTVIDFLHEIPDPIEDEIEARDQNRAHADWQIDQVLRPTFNGTARPIRVRDCN